MTRVNTIPLQVDGSRISAYEPTCAQIGQEEKEPFLLQPIFIEWLTIKGEEGKNGAISLASCFLRDVLGGNATDLKKLPAL